MAKPVGSLVVRIASDTTGLVRGSRQAQSRMQRMGRQAGQTARRITALTAAVAAAGAAIATNLVVQGLKAVDEQAKLARQLDTTIGAVRGLQHAAEEAGVSKEVMGRAAERLNSRLGEAQRGTGSAADALERLGLNARELADMDVDERFATIADRMNEMGLSSAQAADELRQLGIRQGEVVALMREGGDAIRNASNLIEQYGLNISDVDARNIEAANDAWNRTGLVMEGIRAQMAAEVAPVIIAVAEHFNDAAQEAGGWGEAARSAANVAIQAIASVIDAIGQAISVIESNPTVAKYGLAGYALRGSRGALAGMGLGAIQDAFDPTKKAIRETREELDFWQNELSGAMREASTGLNLGDAGPDIPWIVAASEEITRLRGELSELEGDTHKVSDGFQQTADVIRGALENVEAAADGPELMGLPDASDFQQAIEDQEEYQAASGGSRANHLSQQLDQLKSHLRDEAEAELFAHRQRMETLEESRDAELITEEEYQRMKEALQEDHEQRMREIKDQSRRDDEAAHRDYLGRMTSDHIRFLDQMQQATATGWGAVGDFMTSELQSMTGQLSNQSKAMFNIQKAAGIANAIVSTYQGMSKALELGWPMGPIAAAAIAARGFANVAAIRAQSFNGGGGGGGSRGGGGGGVAQAATAQESQRPQMMNINIEGDRITRDSAAALIERINEGLQDGHRLKGVRLV